MTINYVQLAPEHFAAIIDLGNHVHGDNYLDENSIRDIYERSFSNNINASWVAVISAQQEDILGTSVRNTPDGYLVGFRLTIAADKWQPDEWCSPELWMLPPNQVCYFKCNTVDENVRGQGVGSSLLKKSIASASSQGAEAGLAHIWLASPGNSAFSYFKACGGKLVKEHANKWQKHSIEDNYDCPVCGSLCECTAAEMLLQFQENEA
ncbi:MAG: ribosomal protein S18 acetylase RimI-like enzyme [Glaciecola sp.]|jgi:ribosomal protein S18 acetylase RimI-like enzyme